MGYLDFTKVANEVDGIEFYKFYPTKEHCLKAEEIAIIYGIYTKTMKPASSFIRALLESKSRNFFNYNQIYYINKNGYKTKVYERELYKSTLEDLVLSIYKTGCQNLIQDVEVNNRIYHIIVTDVFKDVMNNKVTAYDIIVDYYRNH